jgi:hypothetical protein
MSSDAERAARKDTEADPSFDADTDPAPAGVEGKLDVDPVPGGYAGRDPKTEMPSVPSVPETYDDPGEHDAAPDPEGRSPHS